MCWWWWDVWPCLAEMSWLGWNHWVPQPRGSFAGTKCGRAQPDPVWVNFPTYTSWFHGNFQKSSPNDSRSWRSTKEFWCECSGSSWELLYLFFWSTKSLCFWARLDLDQLLCPTMDRSGQRNTIFCFFFSIPALGQPQFPLILLPWPHSSSHPKMCER